MLKAIPSKSPTFKFNKVEEKKEVTSVDELYKLFVKSYLSTFNGTINDRTLFGCNLIARSLNDIFNIDKSSLNRNKYLNNNYFDYIEEEDKKGYILIAFGESCILELIRQYSVNNYEYSIQNAAVERQITLNSILAPDTLGNEVYNPVEKINLSNLHIYSFNTTEGIKYMIFSNINVDDANRVNIFMNTNIDTEDYFVVSNVYFGEVEEFTYLYPVKYEVINTTYFTLKSNILTKEEIKKAWYNHEVSFTFNKLDSRYGTYGAHLLNISTNNKFRVEFIDNKLIFHDCAYLQGIDLLGYFSDYINDAYKENILFTQGRSSKWKTITVIDTGIEYSCIGSINEEIISLDSNYKLNIEENYT